MGCTSDQDSENVLSNLQNEHDDKRSVIKKKGFKCNHPECDGKFLGRLKFERHIKQHTEERRYICDAPGCTKSYVFFCQLKKHLKTHDLIEIVYKCSQCSKMIVNAYNLKLHYKEHHGKGFGDINKLKHHKKNHEKLDPCQISGCSDVFCKSYLLHVIRDETEHNSWVSGHKCDKCNKIFRSKQQLGLHSKTHSEDRRVIPCPYKKCRRVYYYKCNLDQHIKVKHLGKKYYCDICSTGLASKQKLINHIERQTLCNKNIMTQELNLELKKIREKYQKKK